MGIEKFGLSPLLLGSIVLISITLPVFAGNNKQPAPKPAAPVAHPAGNAMTGNAGAHVPGNAANAAHMPSNVPSAHVPSNVPAAHVPSNVPTAHVPGNMSAAHTPTNVAAAHAPGNAGPHAGGNAAGAHAQPHAATAHAGGHAVEAHANNAGHGEAAHAGVASPHGAEHTVPREAVIAHAQEHRDISREHEFAHAHEHDFHTRDVRSFNEHERGLWRAGRWHNDWHYGRYGWWWLVGGVWYEYANPVYPYPVVVAPIVIREEPVVEAPLPLYQEAPGPNGAAAPYRGPVGANGQPAGTGQLATASPSLRESAIPRLPAVQPGSYRCATPVSDYPVIGTCPSGWVFVPDPPQTTMPQ